MNFIIPNEIKTAVSALENAGFDAFIVGGCVRDLFLSKTPQDYDITTSAMPEEVISLFLHTIPTGIKHGTVTVVFENNEKAEITTFRTEENYLDNRHPEKINFVRNIEEDLSRRDFTINAMAYSEKAGLKDPFDGLEDLKNGILRAVGAPVRRFNEDALRIMRLFRFSAQLGFQIEENTLESALNLAHTLSFISCERIRDEILKTLCSQNPKAILPLIKTDALSFVGIDKRSVCFEDLNKIPCDDISRFSLFCFKNNLSPYDISRNLRCSKAFSKTCKNICDLLKNDLPSNKIQIKQILKNVPVSDFETFIKIASSLFCDTDLSEIFSEIISNKEPFAVSQLKINGNDLMEMGIKSKAIKTVLEKLLDLVIESPELNTKEQLKSLVTK